MIANTSIAEEQQPEEGRFLVFPLKGLLPATDHLTVDREQKILSQVRKPEGITIEQQRLTDTEYYVLIELISSYPNYCPMPVLLSAYTGKSLERCEEAFARAMAEGDLNPVARPTRHIISRAREKILPFQLDAKSIIETGYVLLKAPLYRRPRRQ